MKDTHDKSRIQKMVRMSPVDWAIIEEKVKKSKLNFTQYAIKSLRGESINIKQMYANPEDARLIHRDISQLSSHVNALSTIINRHYAGAKVEGSPTEKVPTTQSKSTVSSVRTIRKSKISIVTGHRFNQEKPVEKIVQSDEIKELMKEVIKLQELTMEVVKKYDSQAFK